MAETQFSAFVGSFPPTADVVGVDADALAKEARTAFDVRLPALLVDLWRECGAGYFGSDGELCLFADKRHRGRASLLEWNSEPFWAEVFPKPNAGGPLFFGETAFGDQLGFRWEGGRCRFVLFVVDCFDLLMMTEDAEEFFFHLLPDRSALFEPGLYEEVRSRLGPPPRGMHYVPAVSPSTGGSQSSENYLLGPARVHVIDAILLQRSVRSGGERQGDR